MMITIAPWVPPKYLYLFMLLKFLDSCKAFRAVTLFVLGDSNEQ